VSLTPFIVLVLFGAGLIIFRSAVVRVAAVVFLLIGVYLGLAGHLGIQLHNLVETVFRTVT